MAEPAPPPAPQVAIERIYLRDLSFESPQVPAAFGSEWTPQVKLDLNSGARRLDEGRFEVVLTLTLALGESSGGTTLLVVEVQQAGIFRIEGMDEATLAHALAVTCPTVLYPYARETVDALAIQGVLSAVHAGAGELRGHSRRVEAARGGGAGRRRLRPASGPRRVADPGQADAGAGRTTSAAVSR